MSASGPVPDTRITVYSEEMGNTFPMALCTYAGGGSHNVALVRARSRDLAGGRPLVVRAFLSRPIPLDFVQPARPEGGCWAFIGRQGANLPRNDQWENPVGRLQQVPEMITASGPAGDISRPLSLESLDETILKQRGNNREADR